MARLEPLKMEALTPEQKELYDVVGRGRAQVAGPFGVWLRNPPLADAANRVTLALRENGKLDKRLFELIVLTAARAWGASYAWVAHEKPAIKAGLAPELVNSYTETPVGELKLVRDNGKAARVAFGDK